MGTICSINARPKTWPMSDQGGHLKARHGVESVVMVEYGSMDDYPEGQSPMTMFMRKSIYQNCLSGDYRVDVSSQNDLMLLDRNGLPVTPLSPGIVY